MRPKSIILVRHGESEANVNREVYGHTPDHKIDLTVKGCLQALEAGRALKSLLKEESVQYYISPHKRSRETYKGLIRGGCSEARVFEDPRIREQDWGHFRTQEEMEKIKDERYKYGTFYYRLPNGESGADVFDRVSGFIETLHRDFHKESYPNNSLIVTHGLTIRLFLMRWFHCSVEEFESWDNPFNCQYFIMQLQADGKYSKPVLPLAESGGAS